MKNRIDSKGNYLVIGTTAEGVITTGNNLFPKKNIFVKPEKSSYSIESKSKYREFSKQIAERVSNTKLIAKESKEIELLKRKYTAKVIADSLNKVIINTTVE